MEQNPENNVVITIPSPPLDDEHEPKVPPPIRSRKRSNGLHALKAALFPVRSRSRKSSVLPVDDGSNSVWRKLVGSMRPLHLQSNQSPRSHSPPNGEPFDQVTLPPPSPLSDYKSDFSAEEEPYSPSPPSSRYASAVGLNELVQNDEDNEKQDVIVEDCNEQHGEDGDVMIDSKAEEFIAQFYQEMRLQRMNSADRCYEERSHRSLGW